MFQKITAFLFLAFLLFNNYSTKAQNSNFTSNFPIVVINTYWQTIPDSPKIKADMGIIYNGEGKINKLTDDFNNYNGKIGIEIRGSSSQMFPKKSYGFETWDTSGNSINVPLLNMPAESDWILSAFYDDKSLMRNTLTFKIGRELGHYASRTMYCEVFLNGDYQGVYLFMEKIKRSDYRVNISKLKTTDIAGDDVTGGYIIKLDKPTGTGGNDGWDSKYPSYVNSSVPVHFLYDYPKSTDIVPQQSAYIQNYMNDFETALSSANFTDTVNGYAKYIDVNSFVDNFIINEFTNNVDGFRLSAYLYKTKITKGGKLFAGPIWDYDLGYGNVDFSSNYLVSGWQYLNDGGIWQVPFWWQRLLNDPRYTGLLKCRWLELRKNILQTDSLMNYIDTTVNKLSAAEVRNFARWQILGTYVWPNHYVGPDYPSEINYLKNWIQGRLFWLDGFMPGTCVTSGVNTIQPQNNWNIFPNPTTGKIYLNLANTENKTLNLKLTDLLGKEVLVINNYKAKELDLTGLTNGVYFLTIQLQNAIQSFKVVLKK